MQSRATGAKAAKFGHLAATLIGQGINATKISETSNEFEYGGNKVAIKVARMGTPSVGVSHEMLNRIQFVIGAFEVSPGEFALISLPVETFRSNMRVSVTSKGKTFLVTKKVFESHGNQFPSNYLTSRFQMPQNQTRRTIC